MSKRECRLHIFQKSRQFSISSDSGHFIYLPATAGLSLHVVLDVSILGKTSSAGLTLIPVCVADLVLPQAGSLAEGLVTVRTIEELLLRFSRLRNLIVVQGRQFLLNFWGDGRRNSTF